MLLVMTSLFYFGSSRILHFGSLIFMAAPFWFHPLSMALLLTQPVWVMLCVGHFVVIHDASLLLLLLLIAWSDRLNMILHVNCLLLWLLTMVFLNLRWPSCNFLSAVRHPSSNVATARIGVHQPAKVRVCQIVSGAALLAVHVSSRNSGRAFSVVLRCGGLLVTVAICLAMAVPNGHM